MNLFDQEMSKKFWIWTCVFVAFVIGLLVVAM
jgi:hypothetical protein